jgi:YfiH family protein
VPPVAWLKQIHSDRALAASSAFPGYCGEGDGLFTSDTGLALSIATADCVPVVLASRTGRLAAVHAGWRGIANGIVLATLAAMGGPREDPRDEPRGDFLAWIGPSIGPCCYEVDEDVSRQVIAASGPQAAVPGPTGKPHLDLQGAVRLQLARAGIHAVEGVPDCTRCGAGRLYSYRREGKGAGRNLAFIWRR